MAGHGISSHLYTSLDLSENTGARVVDTEAGVCVGNIPVYVVINGYDEHL